VLRVKSLLVIKPSSLGDIVHALQVVQTLARERPGCRISWVVRERFAGLVQAAPFVHEAIVFRRRDGWRAFLRLLRDLRGRRFDAVWDMQGLLRSGLMTAAARAPEKWGRHDAREGAGMFYRGRVALPNGPGPHHALEILLPFLATAGVAPRLDFPLALRESLAPPWSAFFAGDSRNTFVIFTDSRGAGKEWPRFDELTALLLAELPGSRVAWCAGKPAEPRGPLPEPHRLPHAADDCAGAPAGDVHRQRQRADAPVGRLRQSCRRHLRPHLAPALRAFPVVRPQASGGRGAGGPAGSARAGGSAGRRAGTRGAVGGAIRRKSRHDTIRAGFTFAFGNVRTILRNAALTPRS
jgi:hypothetical protein